MPLIFGHNLSRQNQINDRRLAIWNHYNEELECLEKQEYIRRPVIPDGCTHNAHMFYIKAKDLDTRTRLITFLKEQGIQAVFHYIPLHTAPAGQKFGDSMAMIFIRQRESEALVRLPLFIRWRMHR